MLFRWSWNPSKEELWCWLCLTASPANSTNANAATATDANAATDADAATDANANAATDADADAATDERTTTANDGQQPGHAYAGRTARHEFKFSTS